MRPNHLALRNLAIIAIQRKQPGAARDLYRQAWACAPTVVTLAVEICQFLQQNESARDLDQFVADLPPAFASHERIRLAFGLRALHMGDWGRLREILDQGYASIREGEILLTDLWFTMHVRQEEQRVGRSLTSGEVANLVRNTPPPARIDFRMNDSFTILK